MEAPSRLSPWLFGGCFAMYSEFLHRCIFEDSLTSLSTVRRMNLGQSRLDERIGDLALFDIHQHPTLGLATSRQWQNWLDFAREFHHLPNTAAR
jgi:hypothetical protein